MTRVPRRHGDRHGESKGTSTKISDLKKMVLAYSKTILIDIDQDTVPQENCLFFFRNPGAQQGTQSDGADRATPKKSGELG